MTGRWPGSVRLTCDMGVSSVMCSVELVSNLAPFSAQNRVSFFEVRATPSGFRRSGVGGETLWDTMEVSSRVQILQGPHSRARSRDIVDGEESQSLWINVPR